jgi:pimeloyl-ACP methyl ester carboxylesterase
VTEIELYTVDGVRLVGTDVGDGPVALLLHAGGERRAVWAPISNALAGRGFRAIAWDQRGHGDSASDAVDELPRFAEDVAAMLGGVNAMPVLVGASLGGLAAMLALENASVRRQVASLVLVDVVPDPDPQRVRAFVAEAVPDISVFPLVDDVLGRADELRGAVSSLDLPTKLVRGGAGPIQDADASRFVELVNHARLEVVENAEHLVAQQAPDELAAHIAEELERPEVRLRRIRHLLERMGAAGQQHPSGILGDHLQRVGDTLESWQAPDWVIDAGRLHAIYGTDGLPAAFGDVHRAFVRSAVGAKAEQLITLYCRCDRAQSYSKLATRSPTIVDRSTGERQALTSEQLPAFMELTVANELDVLTRDAEIAARYGESLAGLFSRWTPFLSEPARVEVECLVERLQGGASSPVV